MRGRKTLSAFALMAVAARGNAQTVVFGDTPVCATCRIVVERVVSLTSPGDSAFFDFRVRVLQLRDGRYLAGATRYAGSFALFDSAGRFLRVVGRVGKGPGEFAGITQFVSQRNGSVLVFDALTRRQSRLAPDLTFAGSRPFPYSARDVRLAGGDTIVMTADLPVPFAVHVVDGDRKVVRSFAKVSRDRTGDVRSTRRFGSVRGRNVWVAHLTPYIIEEWTLDGTLVRSIERKAAWFPGVQVSANGRQVSAPGALVGTWVDSAGVLWTVSGVPDPRARPVRPTRGETGVPGLDEMNERWDVIVEAIDPARGVLATLRLPHAPLQLSANQFFTSFRSDDANDVIDVWRVRLTR